MADEELERETREGASSSTSSLPPSRPSPVFSIVPDTHGYRLSTKTSSSSFPRSDSRPRTVPSPSTRTNAAWVRHDQDDDGRKDPQGDENEDGVVPSGRTAVSRVSERSRAFCLCSSRSRRVVTHLSAPTNPIPSLSPRVPSQYTLVPDIKLKRARAAKMTPRGRETASSRAEVA